MSPLSIAGRPAMRTRHHSTSHLKGARPPATRSLSSNIEQILDADDAAIMWPER